MSLSVQTATQVVLMVSDVVVDYETDGELYRALDGATLRVGVGETVGLVGESGSGKSSLALAVGGLLPTNARVQGEVVVGDISVLTGTQEELRSLRRRDL